MKTPWKKVGKKWQGYFVVGLILFVLFSCFLVFSGGCVIYLGMMGTCFRKQSIWKIQGWFLVASQAACRREDMFVFRRHKQNNTKIDTTKTMGEFLGFSKRLTVNSWVFCRGLFQTTMVIQPLIGIFMGI